VAGGPCVGFAHCEWTWDRFAAERVHFFHMLTTWWGRVLHCDGRVRIPAEKGCAREGWVPATWRGRGGGFVRSYLLRSCRGVCPSSCSSATLHALKLVQTRIHFKYEPHRSLLAANSPDHSLDPVPTLALCSKDSARGFDLVKKQHTQP